MHCHLSGGKYKWTHPPCVTELSNDPWWRPLKIYNFPKPSLNLWRISLQSMTTAVIYGWLIKVVEQAKLSSSTWRTSIKKKFVEKKSSFHFIQSFQTTQLSWLYNLNPWLDLLTIVLCHLYKLCREIHRPHNLTNQTIILGKRFIRKIEFSAARLFEIKIFINY